MFAKQVGCKRFGSSSLPLSAKMVFMKTMILILVLITNILHGQSKQDSVQLKSGSRATKATFSEKIDGKVVRYKTVYLSQSDNRLFVIAYNERKRKYEKKLLPKNIEID